MRLTQENLTELIADFIPEGRIEKTRLSQCPEICLYLLHPDYHKCRLTREQGTRLMAEPMFWPFCWASGQAIARYVLDNPEMVRDKCVLDFGCGSGVAGIAAAKAGAKKVWACDLDPLAIQAAASNCRLNGVCVELIEDWMNCTDDPDLILAADILYDRSNLSFLNQFTARAPQVLVADSRVRHFNFPQYRRINQLYSETIPDLDESDAFGCVNVYFAERP